MVYTIILNSPFTLTLFYVMMMIKLFFILSNTIGPPCDCPLWVGPNFTTLPTPKEACKMQREYIYNKQLDGYWENETAPDDSQKIWFWNFIQITSTI